MLKGLFACCLWPLIQTTNLWFFVVLKQHQYSRSLLTPCFGSSANIPLALLTRKNRGLHILIALKFNGFHNFECLRGQYALKPLCNVGCPDVISSISSD